MSKDITISILLPITEQFDKDKIYDRDDLSNLDEFYKKAPDDAYLKTLKVSSTYASFDEMSKCAAQKLKTEERAFSIKYLVQDNGVKVSFPGGQSVFLSGDEIKAAATEHVSEDTFCRYYNRYGPRCDGCSDIVSSLVKDNRFVYIDDELIHQAEKLTGEVRSIEELEGFLEDDSSYGFGCIMYLSAAKQLAEKVGGAAILEYE